VLQLGPAMPDRSKVMIHTKRDTLVLQVGCLAGGLTTPPRKKRIFTEVEQREKLGRLNDGGRK